MGVFRQKKPDPRREEQYYSTSREYKIFQEVERAKLNWYERVVQASGRVLTGRCAGFHRPAGDVV